jgi:membrane protein
LRRRKRISAESPARGPLHQDELSLDWGADIQELAVRTWREANEDNILGRAAELAYYFLLALFPMLIFLTSLVGFLPGLREAIFTALGKFVPGEAMRLVSETISDVTRHRSGGLISFGVLGALAC